MQLIDFQSSSIWIQKFIETRKKLELIEAERMTSNATRETCEHSMAEAVREAFDENDGKRDLAVAVDGSWQKSVVFLRRMAW
ncbi:hypothetical protein TNCV_974581 [Trichonephila clavipes]|nr:hypothetical protein TNCV_974581 [Trichonephila clavipes]